MNFHFLQVSQALGRNEPFSATRPTFNRTGRLTLRENAVDLEGRSAYFQIHKPVILTKHMNTVVPLISSGVAGPLGVLHLPRLWLKASLEAAGKLAPGYPGAGKGYDQMVIDGLGLQRDAVLGFIKNSKPTYPQFEAWVKKNGTKLDRGSIDKLNSAIKGYLHDDGTRKSILSANGLPDDAQSPKDAVNLNNLDDWKEFHDAVLK